MAEEKMALDGLGNTWMTDHAIRNPEIIADLLKSFSLPKFSVGQVGISRQELQYWRKNELISIGDPNTKSWSKVSFFEYCWLRLVLLLRATGVPINSIKKIKTHLFRTDEEIYYQQFLEHLKTADGRQMIKDMPTEVADVMLNHPEQIKEMIGQYTTTFMLLVFELIRRNSPASLIVYPNGDCSIYVLNEHVPDKLSKLLALFADSFTAVPLNSILNEFYVNPRIKEVDIKDIFNLSEKESKVLGFLRKENIREVRVRLGENGKGIIMIEVVEQKQLKTIEAHLAKILKKGKFQDFRIVSQDGNLVLFEETTKIKV